MLSRYKQINDILTQWNPIGVPENIAKDEYRSYVPQIINAAVEKDKLMQCLENIIVNEIGLDFDKDNPEQIKDLQLVCAKILEL